MAKTITGFKSIPNAFLISRTSDQLAIDGEIKNPLPAGTLHDEAYMLSCKDSNGFHYRSWAINVKTIENLKMMKGSYDVKISNKGLGHFKNCERALEYWIATEQTT